MRPKILCSFSISLATSLAIMTQAAPSLAADIWGETIMPQPFDKKPFRQINIPAWVEGTLGCGYTLSAMDEKQRARAAAAGITISEMASSIRSAPTTHGRA
jgi:hypothetical protein